MGQLGELATKSQRHNIACEINMESRNTWHHVIVFRSAAWCLRS